MTETAVRIGVLVLVVLPLGFLAWSGRRFVEMRRRQALMAAPLDIAAIGETVVPVGTASKPARVRILAFSSADCHQCHTLQAPAIKRLLETRGEDVAVVEVDAPSAPELTRRYHVLTLPTTVVLDATGRAHAVNYGFATTQRLLEQVDAVLAQ